MLTGILNAMIKHLKQVSFHSKIKNLFIDFLIITLKARVNKTLFILMDKITIIIQDSHI